MGEGDSGIAEYRQLFGAKVHNPVDMNDVMLKHAIDSARKHIAEVADFQKEGDTVVSKLKAEFDTAYGPNWHVIIGKHFGSRVTHDSKCFAFFYLDVSRWRGRRVGLPWCRAWERRA